MKDFLACVLSLYLFISFVFVSFGVWPMITLVCGVVLGFIYVVLT